MRRRRKKEGEEEMGKEEEEGGRQGGKERRVEEELTDAQCTWLSDPLRGDWVKSINRKAQKALRVSGHGTVGGWHTSYGGSFLSSHPSPYTLTPASHIPPEWLIFGISLYNNNTAATDSLFPVTCKMCCLARHGATCL